MLVHVPVGLFVLYFVDNIGLKKSFWISTTLNVIGTGVRLGGVTKWWQLDGELRHFHFEDLESSLKLEHPILSKACSVSSIWYPDEATLFHHGSTYDIFDENTTFSDVEYSNWYCPSPEWGYPVSLFGMIITAISMSFRTGLPSKLTAQWFEPNEYDIANSMASLADPLGTMIACLFAPFIAKEPSDLLHLQIYFAIPVFLSFFGSLLIRQEGYKNEVNDQSFKEMVAFILN